MPSSWSLPIRLTPSRISLGISRSTTGHQHRHRDRQPALSCTYWAADRGEPGLVEAMAIGEHGTSEVLLWSSATVAGLPIQQACQQCGESFEKVVRPWSVMFGTPTSPSSRATTQPVRHRVVCARLTEAVLRDERSVFPVASYQATYGVTLALRAWSVEAASSASRASDVCRRASAARAQRERLQAADTGCGLRPRVRDLLLLTLTAAAGSADAVSFLGLGGSYGQHDRKPGAPRHRDRSGQLVGSIRSVIAFAAFVLGVLVGVRVTSRTEPTQSGRGPRPWLCWANSACCWACLRGGRLRRSARGGRPRYPDCTLRRCHGDADDSGAPPWRRWSDDDLCDRDADQPHRELAPLRRVECTRQSGPQLWLAC